MLISFLKSKKPNQDRRMASDTDEENVAVVLDVGSYHLSYGMSGDDIPKFSKLATATKDDTNNGQVIEFYEYYSGSIFDHSFLKLMLLKIMLYFLSTQKLILGKSLLVVI